MFQCLVGLVDKFRFLGYDLPDQDLQLICTSVERNLRRACTHHESLMCQRVAAEDAPEMARLLDAEMLFSGFKSNWNVDMTQQSARPTKPKQWYHAGPFAQESKRLMPNAPHFPLNTTLPTSKHLKCFPNFIAVEGHTDWITVTILMCELQVSVTGCTGHIDLNVNQTTPLL